MKKLVLLFLLIAGCGGETQLRHVAYMPIAKERLNANSAYWHVLVEDANGNQYTLLEWNSEALRVVPGVPVSVCEHVRDGVVVSRQIARRVD